MKTTPENNNELSKKVHAKDFTIVANYANPLKGQQIYLYSDYNLRIKNDSAFAYLPYFGEAYVAPYDLDDDGIKFAEPMTFYSINQNKKSNGWVIHFKVKAKYYQYDIFLSIFNNGSSMFTVNSYNRDAITFNGELMK